MIDFESAFKENNRILEDLAPKLAKAERDVFILREMKPSILAAAFDEIEGKTVKERENKAYASPNYKLHVQGAGEAIEKYRKFKCEYEIAKAKIEELKCLCATETAKIRTFNG